MDKQEERYVKTESAMLSSCFCILMHEQQHQIEN